MKRRTTAVRMSPVARIDWKYRLYEASVQDPVADVTRLLAWHRQLVGRTAWTLREDFAGTFQIACEWVRRSQRHRALAIDLDPEPLGSGLRRHATTLTPTQRARLEVRRANVLDASTPLADVTYAPNFSAFTFKTRRLMRAYFEAVRASLNPGGICVLEIAGGHGMLDVLDERRKIPPIDGRSPGTYVWEQRAFDPITHNGQYAITFELRDGTTMRRAFEYDWRMWTVPELRELLEEAGFARSVVYWEKATRDGGNSGKYAIAEKAEHDYAWVSYVVGIAP